MPNACYGTQLPTLDGSFWDRDAFGAPPNAPSGGGAGAGRVEEFSGRFASSDQRGQLEPFTDAVWPRIRPLVPSTG